jgi:hypothetical protein
LGQFSGFIFIATKISAQKFFLVAAIYEHLVGGLVKTLFSFAAIFLARITAQFLQRGQERDPSQIQRMAFNAWW